MAGARGKAREKAILEATYELLDEEGYHPLTIDAVAARARASKSTIYSRWPDKAALVTAALQARAPYQPDASLDSGNLEEDLRELTRLFVQLAEEESLRAFVSVILASISEPKLMDGLNSAALSRRRQDCNTLMEQAASRGEPTMDGDLLFDLLLGKMLVRYLVERRPLTEDVQEEFVKEAILPLLKGDEVN